jgi:hypothetical protein
MSTQPSVYERIQSQQKFFHQASIDIWPGSQPVDRLHRITSKEIVENYVRRNRPVVIADAVPRDAVSPSTLRVRCGSRQISQLAGAGGSHVLVRGRESAVANFRALATVGDYLAGFEAGADLPYLTNLCIYTNFPEMLKEFTPPGFFEPNWKTRWPLSALAWERGNPIGAELFMAPAGTGYGTLHFDSHAVFVGTCQYFGRKLWWLCPPEDSENVYPLQTAYRNVSPVDPFMPDYGQYPLFAKVKPYVVTLEPGDAMFVPASWWHVTHAVTPNLSTIVRMVNRHNLPAHLWSHRYYAWNAPATLANSLKNWMARAKAR